MQDVENELVNVLTPQQLQDLLGSMEPTGPAPKHQEKIDHFVILFMENRAFDHLFGCHDKPGIDGVAGGHQVCLVCLSAVIKHCSCMPPPPTHTHSVFASHRPPNRPHLPPARFRLASALLPSLPLPR